MNYRHEHRFISFGASVFGTVSEWRLIRDPVLLKASTLTTHGVIFGMTGSGKTGLGVNILEEALLGGTPTLILDPKGDMGNILLNFPDSAPDDLEPWMDAGKAKRKGVTIGELAAKEAAERQAELAGHGITPERIARLRDNTEFRIYTPGSSIGVPINVLGSLKAPDLDWQDSAETIRDEIEGLVSSILVLAGIKSDPVSGPEHILIATIIETWWRQGKDLDLATLVGQIPKPPFRKLGVFDLEMFFPEKQRMKLALQLNSLLASPSMASWLEGEPLDIENLLRGRRQNAMRHHLHGASQREGTPVRCHAAPLEGGHLDAIKAGHFRTECTDLHGRGLWLCTAIRRAAVQETHSHHPETGPCVWCRAGACDPEPGRSRLQGHVECRNLDRRAPADRKRQTAHSRRHIRRHAGPGRTDLQPREAPVHFAPRQEVQTDGVQSTALDVLPVRAIHTGTGGCIDGAAQGRCCRST
jgi:hypothetical protein